MDCCKHVDLFYGNGEIDSMPESGVGAKWIYVKAQCGNTVPHAALPFGRMTVGAYSGGYPCGYGTHYPNSCGGIRKLWDKNVARGFSHIHQSGVGAIQYYYNYAIVTPFYGEVCNIEEFHELKKEKAVPGYYSASISDIDCELTVDENTAYHRYSFGSDSGRIAIDFANDGLNKIFGQQYYAVPKDVHIEQNNLKETLVSGIYHGVKLYFCVVVEAENVKCRMFDDNAEFSTTLLDPIGGKYGSVYDFDGNSALVKISYSTVSIDEARKNIHKSKSDFDSVSSKAYSLWNEYLSAVKIETDDEELCNKFYSNMYHSLIKPCDMTGENILGVKGDVCVDFATFWDMYKTTLPLIFTLYPEMGEKIVKSIVNISKTHGKLLCSFGMADVYPCEEQARMLGIYVLCDAYYRGIPSATKDVIEECTRRELERSDFQDFIESGVCERYTHILDMADACANVAEIVEDKEFSVYLKSLAKNLCNAYDKDGILSDKSQYYEGDKYTYSFRLHNDMDSRITLAGGPENYAKLLDNYFGIDGEDIQQVKGINDIGSISSLLNKYHRFEGFNNEPDMEVPYGYIYINRHERLCQILDACIYDSFGTGRGGLPGNNDSGGLSSCFVWNFLGVFPVSGQNLILLGKPFADKAEFILSNNKAIKIIRHGKGQNVKKIIFNDVVVEDYKISAIDFMQGGQIDFFMHE